MFCAPIRYTYLTILLLMIISDDAMLCVLIGCAPNTRSFFMFMYSFFIGYATLDEPFDWMYLP